MAGRESQDLAPDLALPGAVVEIQQDDLLPGPQLEPSLVDGDAQGRLEEGRPDVGIAVAVPPAAVMGIGQVLGEKPLDGGL